MLGAAISATESADAVYANRGPDAAPPAIPKATPESIREISRMFEFPILVSFSGPVGSIASPTAKILREN